MSQPLATLLRFTTPAERIGPIWRASFESHPLRDRPEVIERYVFNVCLTLHVSLLVLPEGTTSLSCCSLISDDPDSHLALQNYSTTDEAFAVWVEFINKLAEKRATPGASQ